MTVNHFNFMFEALSINWGMAEFVKLCGFIFD